MKLIYLLHGALGSAIELSALQETIINKEVRVIEFPGHGRTTGSDEEFTIEGFAKHLANEVLRDKPQKIDVFGYSMGGYVALYLESKAAGTFNSITTYGTKFEWSKEIAKMETSKLNYEKMMEKIPAYISYLERIHPEQEVEMLLGRTKAMMNRLGEAPLLTPEVLESIHIPVTIGWGELDNMVTKEESAVTSSHLVEGGLEVLASMPHPLGKVDNNQLLKLLKLD